MSALRDFLVPDLGEGLEDATITGWAVAVGDEVALNQTLCTVETNKAEVEIPSPYAGRIAELGGAEGQTLPVGSVLVRIETADAEQTPRKPVLVGYGTDDALDGSRRRARTKPPVRKLAADLDVELDRVNGSGPDGIVTRADVLSAARGAPDAPVTGVRLAMARRMALSRREIPDANASVDVDGTALLRLREHCNSAGAAAVTPFVLVLRMVVAALRRHPELNATWLDTVDGPRVHTHAAIHLGVGVAAPRGLLVPVVTDAQDRTTRQLGDEVARLVAAAREGTLAPSDMQGSTFTVSNFGALGLDDGVPVINHPEAAILGVGALKPRAVVVDGEVVARSTMRLTCAFDHRVADGAQVGAFLGELRSLIEAPQTALLDL
ncbi:branched-chain alpha-keto acid dehydrogenase subunit E2 [Mycolicibacterium chubuense]|uniref:Dihydrolipoamide acetyltransferase component of pyruvate dehydrogenase complex n=1 Tax=Mycolicibacterium chubuense TaxID=1800 RepID=A0A0J6VYZ1_MYCCU|nr:dihydrolipoamide acetyltransferase family protein [Mycolicibacterium chubuense]KMO74632.1 Dihydrolipoyllysine-residue acyltransferase component of branched-chain alpha-ketoacid dehydrogenase complex [Mycolicibacterium chubuense]ORA52087.1 branched-chain alpha-keto acid dehydrogenase subunit E2 [Mycolicibacterium chubuense]SPY46328.1 pyruvate/2-oxoglutarate dehydrogenase complex, dihydrolipoamide acyltransferase component [Mycolicibacterium chubuense]